MIPQINATLTAIGGGGASEDEGGAVTEGADTSKWSGSVGAYVHEEILTEAGATGLNEAKLTYIIISELTGVTVLPRDRLTFTYKGSSQQRIAQNVAAHTLNGHNKTVRISFRET